jgi:hypothetical protein
MFRPDIIVFSVHDILIPAIFVREKSMRQAAAEVKTEVSADQHQAFASLAQR